MTNKERMKKALHTWIWSQVEEGRYKNVDEACLRVAVDYLGLSSGKTMENYVYAVRYPVSAKHVPKLSRLTGISAEVLNPGVFG